MAATRAGQALRDRVQRAWSDLEELTAAGPADGEREEALRVRRRIEANLTTAPAATDSAGGAAAT
ncbi:hypothetical protein [Streptomyces sp. NPDC001153]